MAAEPIDMPFRLRSEDSGGPKEHCRPIRRRGSRSPHRKGQFSGEREKGRPTVKYRDAVP